MRTAYLRIPSIVMAFTIILAATVSNAMAQLAVGSWRDNLSYSSTNKVVEAGNQIWCSSDGGLFYYDLDDLTVNRVNKTCGLTDVGVSTFNYDPSTRCIVVAYDNANIDILKEGRTVNISDIKRSNIGGNKKINGISFFNRCAYLACGFGIVVVDLARNEIKETFYLGDNATSMNINDIIFTDSLIVAATDNGLMMADKYERNLHLPDKWSHEMSSLLAGQRVTHLATDSHGALLALVCNSGSDTTLYREVTPMVFAPLVSGFIRNFESSHGNVVVCFKDFLRIYTTDYTIGNEFFQSDWLDMGANDAILSADGRLWMAHRWASLASINPDNAVTPYSFSPGGPWSDNVFRLTSFDSLLFVCPGGHSSTYTNAYIKADIHTLRRGSWSILQDPDGLLNSLSDIIDVAVNPRNPKVRLAASWGGGIIEITDNRVTNLYNETNSDDALTPYSLNGFTSLRTGGVAYDNKGNAWITNSLSSNVLVVKRSNGSWQSFDTRNMISGGDVNHIIWDSVNDLKLFWGYANRIYVHDGKNHMAYINPNNGSKLQTSSLSALAQDHNGNIWIGTNKGIKVIYNLANVFQNGGDGEMAPVSCSNIIFNANGITEYLMAYESITCITVDGANRKWVGTANGGLYLLSANGLEEIEHFTSANSPLFSDKIISVAVMPWSGEVFIGTDKGLQCYRSNATYAFSEPLDDIHAFPNPVKPDYDGLISIKGFTRNALVHITDANGHTVYSTRANGGQATWNGCTSSGHPVTSGVYYVFASSEDGSNRSSTKILIIR